MKVLSANTLVSVEKGEDITIVGLGGSIAQGLIKKIK
jgi:hypothetical protein